MNQHVDVQAFECSMKRNQFRQPTESVLPETLPAFGSTVEQDDELMGQLPERGDTGMSEGQTASAADPSLLAKPVCPGVIKQEVKAEKRAPAPKAKSVQFESKAEAVEPEIEQGGDAIMKDESTGAEGPSSVKKEEPVEAADKPKPKARPMQKERVNPGVPEPPLPPGTSPQAMRSAPVLAKSTAPSAPRPIPHEEEPMLNRELYDSTSLPLMPKFPEHNMALTSPHVKYMYDTVPVALAEYVVPGFAEHEDEDPILESYLHPPTMDQRKFSARAYKLISNKQHKALTKLMFYERGAAANELGKLFEASTVSLSENFRNANMAYTSQEAKLRMIGGERVRTVRLTETIKNSIPHDPRPDWGLVAFLEKEIVYAIGQMREFDRQNFGKSFKPATPYKEATVLPTWERYSSSAILPLRDLLECLEHARDRFRVMKNQDTVELPNQCAAESYFATKTSIALVPDIAIALMTVFRRDHGKRFEVFVRDDYQSFTTIDTAYQMIAGVRLVFEYGHMPYGVFRKFAMDDESAFATFARGQGPQAMYVDQNYPKWGWGVCVPLVIGQSILERA